MLIPTCVIKFIELLLAVACLTLHQYSFDLTDLPTFMLCSGTFIGYVIVLSGEIIGEMLFAPVELVQDMYFGIVGMFLFSASGGVVLAGRFRSCTLPRTGDHTAAIVAASLALTEAVVMMVDLCLAYMDSEGEDEISEIMSAAADAYVDAFWSATGSCLYACAGLLTIHSWLPVAACARRTYAISAAIIALTLAIVLIIDTLLAFCSAHKDDKMNSPQEQKANA